MISAYNALSAEQLSLSPGQLILVKKKHPDGWWEGELQVQGLYVLHVHSVFIYVMSRGGLMIMSLYFRLETLSSRLNEVIVFSLISNLSTTTQCS